MSAYCLQNLETNQTTSSSVAKYHKQYTLMCWIPQKINNELTPYDSFTMLLSKHNLGCYEKNKQKFYQSGLSAQKYSHI